MRVRLLLLALVTAASCVPDRRNDDGSEPDAGLDAGSRDDAGAPDAGGPADAGAGGCTSDLDCAETARCDAVRGVCECRTGLHACGARCVSNDAVTSCGASCLPCASDPNGDAACVNGACALACRPGFLACGGGCVACEGENARCENGQCRTGCAAGEHACAGRCVDAEDPSACGESCEPCTAPALDGFVATCTAGTCGTGCGPGRVFCRGGCQPGPCTWSERVVESGAGFSPDVGVAIDPQGGVHTVHWTSGGALRTRSTLASGQVITADTTHCGASAMAVDFGVGATHLHVACVVPGSGLRTLMVASRPHAGGEFGPAQTAWSGVDEFYFGLDVEGDALGLIGYWYPSVGYARGGSHYAEFDGTGWSRTPLEQRDRLSSEVSVVTSPGAGPRVTWRYTFNGDKRRIATRGASGWTLSDAPAGGQVVRAAPGGALAWVQRVNGLEYASESNGWALETVATDPSYLNAANERNWDFVVDGLGVPRVAYASRDEGLKLASRIGGSWRVERLSARVASSVRLAVRPDGRPLVVAVSNDAASGLGVYFYE